jgi:hypothetical protein
LRFLCRFSPSFYSILLLVDASWVVGGQRQWIDGDQMCGTYHVGFRDEKGFGQGWTTELRGLKAGTIDSVPDWTCCFDSVHIRAL